MFELIRSIRERDPAKPTFCEVLFGYNGFHAVLFHRMNSAIWRLGLRGLARFFANIARMLTGIEIHPDAKLGQRLFIDHGTGVVIGQTAVVGNDVTLYHGVTLGGVGRSGNLDGKRHPTLEDGVMIGSGAQLLGNIVIGKNAKVGSNSVVTSDIPEGMTALGIPARVICAEDGKRRGYGMPSRQEMEHISFTIDRILSEMDDLKDEIRDNGNSPKLKSAK